MVLDKSIVGRILTSRISEMERMVSVQKSLPTITDKSDRGESGELVQGSTHTFQNITQKTIENPLSITPPSPYVALRADNKESNSRNSINRNDFMLTVSGSNDTELDRGAENDKNRRLTIENAGRLTVENTQTFNSARLIKESPRFCTKDNFKTVSENLLTEEEEGTQD